MILSIRENILKQGDLGEFTDLKEVQYSCCNSEYMVKGKAGACRLCAILKDLSYHGKLMKGLNGEPLYLIYIFLK